ncbi:hypothetical protein R1sor_011591 [Riccia sorocarpa]|uniref:DUF7869 domain-containing protein n=1 Tax=Riccia sorocarpa TaxID=122646 RepID=A0ABD3I1A4_9MARC
MSPPRTFFADFPYPAAKRYTSQPGVQDQNTQEEDEDTGPFVAEVLYDNDDNRSSEGVPVAVRRFKETIREPKPPRPSDEKYHFPNNFTKKEVYDHYKTDMVQVQESLQYLSFKRYWLKYYPLVTIPTTNKFSVCDFCELYKSKRDKATTRMEKADAVEALKLHRKQQAEERATAGRHHWKALDNPKDCAYIQIDGMDQKKTALPHFSKQPKSVDGAALVGVHLVGAMIFHGRLQTRAFLTYNNLKSDSNLTITVLQKILLEWEGILPPTLYLQLDNNVRENKNNILFAYLAMLLGKKVFLKIKLSFLLVGHTHDFVDQMFNHFSQVLRRENAFTMSRLRSVIENSYDPKSLTSVLTQTWDFKHFIESQSFSEH